MARTTDAAELLLRELSKPHRDVVSDVLEWARGMPEEWRGLKMAELVERLRSRFGLTQRQLALLARVPHSKIAKIERGQDVQLNTLARVFAGLGCELVLVPLSRLSAEKLLERTHRLAKRGVIPLRRRGSW